MVVKRSPGLSGSNRYDQGLGTFRARVGDLLNLKRLRGANGPAP